MKVAQIRQKFLDYFASKGHQVVASSSLVPWEDPTLLFTNAGMNQFKDVFLGFEKRPYVRATTSQKCVRAGGKHNDLENVGYTARHHTFFEMLGNFSFGDYFKEDAISFAWEFLTHKEWLGLPKEKLMVTVYASDDEAYNIWNQKIGIPHERIVRIGDNKGAPCASDNFWTMGDTGPCGPCTEIFYDHGPSIAGGPPGSPDEDGDRYIEIWNNVFMQFNRDENGTLHLLPKPSVDTGMGLERISAVLQGVHANYEIDLFQALLKGAARACNVPFNMDTPSLKVIADHIRACSFLIADGVTPSNDGRGYVLRRIIRRALRHGHKLGQKNPFFYTLVSDVIEQMGDAYPELRRDQAKIEDALKQEEVKFAETLDKGMTLLDLALQATPNRLSGQTIFKLYDTFGFPVDLTADICRERGIEFDEQGFEAEMNLQRERARAASSFKVNSNVSYSGNDTVFVGYEKASIDANVVAIFKGTEEVTQLNAGEDGLIILDQTPFYAESGGQAGDIGEISVLGGVDALFDVQDTQKVTAQVTGHLGRLSLGHLSVGDKVQATIDLRTRTASMRNHSATHLLHAALRNVLGTHVQQKGSLVNADRTRFDFAHTGTVDAASLQEIERMVNHVIMSNYDVQTRMMSYDDAVKSGAMALFGEKYADEVRVLSMGEFSVELCGGTHVKRTGDIGYFKILSETGIAAGVRRVEAITGEAAHIYLQSQEEEVNLTKEALQCRRGELASSVERLQHDYKALQKEFALLKTKMAFAQIDELMQANVQTIGNTPCFIQTLQDIESSALRDLSEKVMSKLGAGVAVLALVEDDKVKLVCSVDKSVTAKVKAGDIIKLMAENLGGKGGGRPDLAQGGGTEVAKLDETLLLARQRIEQALA